MDINSNQTNVTQLPRIKLRSEAHSGGTHLLQEIEASDKQAIRINIDGKRFESFAENQIDTLQCLTTEIQLWAKLIGRRKVHSLYLRHPYRFLEPFELTGLLHCIAVNFSVSHEAKHYVVASETNEITSQHLALIKGLGFNCYQLVITNNLPYDLDQVVKKVSIIRDFGLTSIGIQLEHPDCLDDIRILVKEIEARCEPDYICLGAPWDSGSHVTTKGGDRETARESKDQQKSADTLDLGPEGNAQISEIKVANFCSIERYRAALRDNHLPIIMQPGKHP